MSNEMPMASGDPLLPLAEVMDEATIAQRPRVSLMTFDTVEVVARHVRTLGFTWVWVDGFSGAGKSLFSARLAHTLAWRHVHLDGMTHGKEVDSNRFADHLDRDRVAKAVGTSEERLPVVVDGVCLQEAIAGTRSDSDVLRVYIARVTRPGNGKLHWHDGIDLQQPTASDKWLILDILRYHRSVRPHATADHVLVRVEQHLERLRPQRN